METRSPDAPDAELRRAKRVSSLRLRFAALSLVIFSLYFIAYLLRPFSTNGGAEQPDLCYLALYGGLIAALLATEVAFMVISDRWSGKTR